MGVPTRRVFLRASAGAAWALAMAGAGLRALAQGLGQFAAGPPPCDPSRQPTPAVPAGANYKPGAPERTSLVEPGTAGTKIELTGTVSGVTCGPIKRAAMEFWQADAHGSYDTASFRLRGRQLTDANGAYRLETIVPGPEGRRAPRLHVRVQPPGKPAFTTALFFAEHPANKTDAEFRSELAMKAASPRGGVKAATFDILLDL